MPRGATTRCDRALVAGIGSLQRAGQDEQVAVLLDRGGVGMRREVRVQRGEPLGRLVEISAC
jgi:hypothetical protein